MVEYVAKRSDTVANTHNRGPDCLGTKTKFVHFSD